MVYIGWGFWACFVGFIGALHGYRYIGSSKHDIVAPWCMCLAPSSCGWCTTSVETSLQWRSIYCFASDLWSQFIIGFIPSLSNLVGQTESSMETWCLSCSTLRWVTPQWSISQPSENLISRAKYGHPSILVSPSCARKPRLSVIYPSLVSRRAFIRGARVEIRAGWWHGRWRWPLPLNMISEHRSKLASDDMISAKNKNLCPHDAVVRLVIDNWQCC